MSNPIRGKYKSHKDGGYAMDGSWDNELSRMVIDIGGKSGMLLGTEVDIYPAGEPRHTEKEFAERLHQMLQSVEEAQENTLATSALVADMLMTDSEDVAVFGVLQDVNDVNESFEKANYVMGATPTEAIEKALEVLENEKCVEDTTLTELLDNLKAGLAELAAAIDDVRS